MAEATADGARAETRYQFHASAGRPATSSGHARERVVDAGGLWVGRRLVEAMGDRWPGRRRDTSSSAACSFCRPAAHGQARVCPPGFRDDLTVAVGRVSAVVCLAWREPFPASTSPMQANGNASAAGPAVKKVEVASVSVIANQAISSQTRAHHPALGPRAWTCGARCES